MNAHLQGGLANPQDPGGAGQVELAAGDEDERFALPLAEAGEVLKRPLQLASRDRPRLGIGSGVAPLEKRLQRLKQAAAQERPAQPSLRHLENERLRRVRRTVPPPPGDERGQSLLRRLLAKRGVRGAADAVAQETRSQVVEGRFKVHRE